MRRVYFTCESLGQALVRVWVAELDVLVGVPGDAGPVQRDGDEAGGTVVPQREGV